MGFKKTGKAEQAGEVMTFEQIQKSASEASDEANRKRVKTDVQQNEKEPK